MAPTEILARQHARTLAREPGRGAGAHRTWSSAHSRPQQKRETLRAIETGEVDLVVGTHAITAGIRSGEIAFPKLGLVVIDEQHKFGVEQRRAVKQSGSDPHYLVMTATPIPRTVAMTVFGDLDVSVLRQPPPGRQKVHTYVAGDDRRERWWGFLPQEAPRRPARLRDRAAGRRWLHLRRQPRRGATRREARQGELADFKIGLRAWPHDGTGEGRGDGSLSRAVKRRCSWPRAWWKWASTFPTPR